MNEPGPGTKDGKGAADHDLPYSFGRHPLDYLHTRDYARLLVLRSRLEDRELLRQRGGEPIRPET